MTLLTVTVSSWTDENSSVASPSAVAQTKILPSDDESLACVRLGSMTIPQGLTKFFRCGGKVYDAEKLTGSNGIFHRSCYNCAECSKILEPGSGFHAPSREVYCKGCYGKMFGVLGYGFGHGEAALVSRGGGDVKTRYHYTTFF